MNKYLYSIKNFKIKPWIKYFLLKEQNSILPIEYKQVKYLESNGSQYLDLLRVPNNTDIIEQKFQTKNTTTETVSWYGSMPRQ